MTARPSTPARHRHGPLGLVCALTQVVLVASLLACGGGGQEPEATVATASAARTQAEAERAGDDIGAVEADLSAGTQAVDAATEALPGHGVPVMNPSSTAEDELQRPLASLAPPVPPSSPTCLITNPQPGQNVTTVWVQSNHCPTFPAPACLKLFTAPNNAWSLCAPARELIFLPEGHIFECPIDYREVTVDAAFSAQAASHGSSRLCQRLIGAVPAPIQAAPACTLVNRQLVCPPALPNGGGDMSSDRTPPFPAPKHHLSYAPTGYHFIAVNEVGPPGAIQFRVLASDPHGLGGVELYERLGNQFSPDTGKNEDQIVRRWQAEAALFAGTVTAFDSQAFSLPYAITDPAKRYFFIRAFDKAGNSARSTHRFVERFSNSITIANFSATPSTLPPGGGPVTLSWQFQWADAASIDNGGGAITGGPNWTSGSRVVNVSASTSFTLTANHPTKLSKTATAAVNVLADATAPVVVLGAAPATVVAPGSATLTANASDTTGVTKVEFYRGATLIGTDFSPPYQQPLSFTLANVGNIAYTAKAFDAAGNVGTSNVQLISVVPDTTPPTVSLGASPGGLQVPASTSLTATAADAFGISKVEFYRGATLIATDFTAPYTHSVTFGPADVGSVSFTAKAFDAQGNSAVSAAAVVSVTADSTPPTVSLSASPGTVLLPGGTTLTASASDAVGVTKVEFYRGAALIATDFSAPFTHSVTFGNADIGNVSFTARAFDAQGNFATSAAVIVAVSTPIIGDTHVSPTGNDVGNTTCAQATPCKTINKAAVLAAANATVWLADGSYSDVSQGFSSVTLPSGLTLRAATPGAAVLSLGSNLHLVLAGHATVVGLVINSSSFGTSIKASSGAVLLEGIKFTGSLHPESPAIVASGTAQVSFSPGNVADYTDTLLSTGARFAYLSGTAQLTINGGSLGGTALGTGEYGVFLMGGSAFRLDDSAHLTLNNAQVKVNSSGIWMNGAATQLNMSNSTLMAVAMPGPGAGIFAYKGTPSVTLVGSTISGFGWGNASAPIIVGPFSPAYGLPGATAAISLTNSVLSGGSIGLWSSDGTTPSLATVTGSNAQIKNNYFGGVWCQSACNLDLSGGEVSGNGTQNAALAGSSSFFGGLHLGAADRAYSLKLRNVAVINNASLSTGNTNTASNSGLTLAGNASSSYDLGTGASPGGNTFTGNNSGNQTSGVNVAVAGGVTVQAVGNTFIANNQSANAQGKYLLGSSPCGVSSCNLTSGSGANYRITSGTLRLAQ